MGAGQLRAGAAEPSAKEADAAAQAAEAEEAAEAAEAEAAEAAEGAEAAEAAEGAEAAEAAEAAEGAEAAEAAEVGGPRTRALRSAGGASISRKSSIARRGKADDSGISSRRLSTGATPGLALQSGRGVSQSDDLREPCEPFDIMRRVAGPLVAPSVASRARAST